MRSPVTIIGIGEMAGVFARGLLRCGHPVYPITRDMDLQQAAKESPTPELVLVAVGENDLHPVLAQLPALWRERLALLQNELLPRDWQQHGLDTPTVAPIWFEKKKGREAKVLISTPVYGPRAGILVEALTGIGIASHSLDTPDQLLFELVRKNLYILTTNITGLVAGGTVNELWQRHQELARAVAADVLTLQEYLTGTRLDHERLLEGMLEAFDGDPDHQCMGRSAPARLQRALALADTGGLAVPKLREIGAQAL